MPRPRLEVELSSGSRKRGYFSIEGLCSQRWEQCGQEKAEQGPRLIGGFNRTSLAVLNLRRLRLACNSWRNAARVTGPHSN